MFHASQRCLIVLSLITWPMSLHAAEPTPCPWRGIYPTLVTPLRGSGGGVDTASLARQIARALNNGVHGLVVLDTLGEGEFVNVDEREQVVSTAVRVAFPRVPVIVGIQSCDLREAELELLQAKKLGASAVLVKYRGNPNAQADEVYQFYAQLAALRALPIFYDHHPSQTELSLSSDEVAAIVAMPGIAGIKETTFDLAEASEHIKLCQGGGKAFFTSSALNLTQFLDLGGHGAMCPEAVLLPGATVTAYDAYAHGQPEDARALQEQLYAVLPITRVRPTLPVLTRVAYMAAQDMKVSVPMHDDPSQAQMKAALTCLGVPTPAWVKWPLPELSVWDHRCVKSACGKLHDLDCCRSCRRIPPIPYRTCTNGEPDSGVLLRTGAFQLGRGVGMDLLRSQGDGLQGFPMD